MPFSSELPVWAKVGTKPPATTLNTNGWVPGDKPPADWLNWFFNLSYEAIKELQLESLNVDQKGVVNGVATLGADGKVPSTQINIDVSGLATDEELIVVDERITTHIAKDGTLLQKGHVQLSSSVTSISEGLAATPKAVKSAYDLAVEAKTQANDQKTKWTAVIGSPLLATDTSTVLQSKSQTIKNTLANNLTNKGQSAAGTESLTSLVNKVPLINTGKKFAIGTVTATTTNSDYTYLSGQIAQYRTVSFEGLNFKPTHIYLFTLSGGATSTTTYTENTGDQYPKTVKLVGFFNTHANTNGGLYHIKGDVSTASVTATGFTLPVLANGNVYNFIAVE